MKPLTYYQKLKVPQRELFAQRAKTTLSYLSAHLFRINGPTRTPKGELILRLVVASEGMFSLEEAIEYFYKKPIVNLANEKGLCLDKMISRDQIELHVVEGSAQTKLIEMNITNKPEKVSL